MPGALSFRTHSLADSRRAVKQLGTATSPRIQGEHTGNLLALLVALGKTPQEISKEYRKIQIDTQIKRLKKQRPTDKVIGLITAVAAELTDIVAFFSEIPIIDLAAKICRLQSTAAFLQKDIERSLHHTLNHETFLEQNKNFEFWLKALIFKTLGNPNATFLDLQQKRGITLQLKIEQEGKPHYFSAKETPNMPLWQAVYISLCQPAENLDSLKEICQDTLDMHRLMDDNNRQILRILEQETSEIQNEGQSILHLLKAKPKALQAILSPDREGTQKISLTSLERALLERFLKRFPKVCTMDPKSTDISQLSQFLYQRLLKLKTKKIEEIKKEVLASHASTLPTLEDVERANSFRALVDINQKLTASLQDKLGLFFKYMHYLKNNVRSKIISGLANYLHKALEYVGLWNYLYANAEKTMALRNYCSQLIQHYEKHTEKIDPKNIPKIKALFEHLDKQDAATILKFVNNKKRREFEHYAFEDVQWAPSPKTILQRKKPTVLHQAPDSSKTATTMPTTKKTSSVKKGNTPTRLQGSH